MERKTHWRAHLRPLATIGVVVAAGLAALAPSATAGPPFKERVHDEGTRVFANFCDVDGLTVDYAFSIDLSIHIVAHGRDGLEYYLQRGVLHEQFTSNGRTVTAVARVLEKDKLVTDNGDGTLTIVVLATGNATAYGPDGKAIARNPGQLRFVLHIAADGTVTRGDVVKGSTGRNDDFCVAAVASLTG